MIWRDFPPPAFPGMRIGLMGGSFNPPHEGHRHIAVTALRLLGLHQVWWIVTPGNPLKSKACLASLEKRLELASKTAAHPRIAVTGFEAHLRTAYSANTIAFLLRRSPSAHFVWIGGGDILAGLHRWRRWPCIFSMLPVAIFGRPGWDFVPLNAPAAVRFVSARFSAAHPRALVTAQPPAWGYFLLPLKDVSSTALRQGSNQPLTKPA
jgi:nicotinate-nucleotide adenylyltransferase